jgi:hypothetical protein
MLLLTGLDHTPRVGAEILVYTYRKYYRTPTPATALELFKCLRDYDFSDYHICQEQLYSYWQKAAVVTDRTPFYSNGSSFGERRLYQFGPFANFWLKKIEHYLLTGGRFDQTFCIYDHFPLPGPRLSVTPDIKYTYHFQGDLRSSEVVTALCQHLNYIKKPTALCALPTKWLWLLYPGEILQTILQHPHLYIASMDWEPFYRTPTGLWVNDQMMNWWTGVNFYTCPHNTKHILPTFLHKNDRLISLLNLADKQEHPLDDLVALGDRELCPCGRYFIKFNYIPHVNHAIRGPNGIVYDPLIINKLIGHYQNLQFIQEQTGEVNVLFILPDNQPIPDTDQQIITTFFKQHGLAVYFYPNTFLIIGVHKFVNFWRNTLGMLRRDYQWRERSIFWMAS